MEYRGHTITVKTLGHKDIQVDVKHPATPTLTVTFFTESSVDAVEQAKRFIDVSESLKPKEA